jgi:ferric-dicitrate binding protein FerR (iron transport regulator)
MNDDTGRPVEHDDELARLLAHAGPRARPRLAAETAAYETLRAEWLELTARRRRHRIAFGASAAALLIGVALGLGVLRARDDASLAAPLATIERIEGSQVSWRDERSSAKTITGESDIVRVGQSLSTGADSRAALSWRGGGSLRLDENTRVDLVSERSVRLVSGALYFDSAADHPTSGRTAASSFATPAIETPAGQVVHVGTQFMLNIDAGEVVLSVREGRVRLSGDGFEITVDSGEQLDFDANGVRAQRSIDSFDTSWNWAQEIAPQPNMDGRTERDILSWVARETGRRIVYDSAETEASTRVSIVRGLDKRSPTNMLAMLPVVTDRDVEIRDDVIVVSTR